MKKPKLDIFLVSAIVGAALLGGCVTHTVTRGDSDAPAHTIYKISKEEAQCAARGSC